ncbi:tyrosine-type recombinase/integrase [PVC group bacterium]|nr:tyrosine-type recombinase/integrase [PVC group bacterium]
MKTQHSHSEFTLNLNQVKLIYNTPSNFRDRVLIKTLYFAGLRRFEAGNLRVSDVDFELNRIVVVKGKGAKLRVIPIIDMDFKADLKHLIGERRDGFIFESQKGGQLSVRQINHIVAKAGKDAKITHPNPNEKWINPHLFRHSIVRHLKSMGFQAEWLQNFCGHSSIKTTMDTYGTLGIDEMQEIAAKKFLLIENK